MGWRTIWHRTQFGTGPNLAPIVLWGQFGTKSVKESIWHRTQFGTKSVKGVNLAPESIWHRTQFGTKGVKGSIWHRPVVLCLGTLMSPMRVETFFQWTFISNIRGLFGFVLRGRVKIINTGLFLPTFEEGTDSVVSGGPCGPK